MSLLAHLLDMLVRYLKAEVLVNCSLRGEYHDVQEAQATAI